MQTEEAKKIVGLEIRKAQNDPVPDSVITEVLVLVSEVYAAIQRVIATGKKVVAFVRNLFSSGK